MDSLLVPFIVSFIVVVLVALLLRPLAIRLELVDVPGGRKTHKGHVPLVGGIAMLFGFVAGLLALNFPLHNYRALLAGITVLAFAGLLDDFHELSARAKFVAQLIAALLMVVWGHNKLFTLGHLFFGKAILLQYHLSVPVTVFAILSIINAINMLDGIDGLAGGVVLIELLLLFALAFHAGQALDASILGVLASSVAAFLCLNYRLPGRRRAIVFMGDVGSMFLGFALVWFCVSLSQVAQSSLRP
ncbi:MAG: undecaprenyl-phosphate alpha-N-acetylglucosaminyl 1-phosphate transferase, partial [Legionellaceae bacterium]|nr:undecaprenyl-phosphate alpha-N-acetylglucosaminyl 1-phosphate transferase [Legionellaceae bacterium]